MSAPKVGSAKEHQQTSSSAATTPSKKQPGKSKLVKSTKKRRSLSKDKEISGASEPKKVGNLGCHYTILLEINENCDTDIDNILMIYFLENFYFLFRASLQISKCFVVFFSSSLIYSIHF